MALPGAYLMLDRASGRVVFMQPDNAGASDGLIQVTGAVPTDPGQIIAALHAAAAVPLPLAPGNRWTVAWSALAAAQAAGQRIALQPAP